MPWKVTLNICKLCLNGEHSKCAGCGCPGAMHDHPVVMGTVG